ncbi:hypothetical protein [Providencia huashanensis]|uniref:hypothetical protein n=1 Tax=Providencia huashanensis TaxID=3037798 RepID=UPI00404524BE
MKKLMLLIIGALVSFQVFANTVIYLAPLNIDALGVYTKPVPHNARLIDKLNDHTLLITDDTVLTDPQYGIEFINDYWVVNTKTNRSQYIYLDYNTGIVNFSKNDAGVLVISREDETDRIMSDEEVSMDVLN